MGRPAWVPTSEQRMLVEVYAAVGIPREIIGDLLGIGVKALGRACRKELDNGLAKANAKVGSKLFMRAMAGDKACMMFWLKTRAGWRETERLEHTGANGGAIEHTHQFDFSQLTDEELAQLEGLRARLAIAGPDQGGAGPSGS